MSGHVTRRMGRRMRLMRRMGLRRSLMSVRLMRRMGLRRSLMSVRLMSLRRRTKLMSVTIVPLSKYIAIVTVLIGFVLGVRIDIPDINGAQLRGVPPSPRKGLQTTSGCAIVPFLLEIERSCADCL